MEDGRRESDLLDVSLVPLEVCKRNIEALRYVFRRF